MPQGKRFRRSGKTGSSGRFAAGRKVKRRSERNAVAHSYVEADLQVRLWPLDAWFFDLVEQGLVADAEDDRRLAPVPVHLAQSIGDDGSLRVQRRLASNFGEPPAVLRRRSHRLRNIVVNVLFVCRRRRLGLLRRRVIRGGVLRLGRVWV